MHDTAAFVKMFARFPFALRRVARHRLTPESSRELVRQRIRDREARLVGVLEHAVFSHERSPYLALFRHAGCELEDAKKLIESNGVDAALATLRDAGVFVRFEEFKGREPIRRGSFTLDVGPGDFDNPNARRDFTVRTGGSTGLPTLVSQDLDHIVEKSPIQMLMFEAYGLLGAPTAQWMHIMPGNGFRFVLQRAYMGQWSDHWYSSMGWREHNEWPRFTAATFYMVASARLAGLKIPFPEFVPLENAIVVARWLSETVKREGRCMLVSNVSHAMRAAIAARDAGLSLDGVTFRIGGEPITTAKADFMRSLGIRVIAGYGMVEVSNIGLGCPNGVDSGDVHLAMDTIALITRPHEIGETGITVPAFQLTTLSDTAGKLLLNVEVDDCGIVERRSCGCVFEQVGLDVHIREIRSYTKLVGEGVTLVGNEMVRILEEFLPARFGGSPLDYQILEEEDENHLTRVFLIVSPRVSIPDEQVVVDALHEALDKSSASAGVASAVWRQAGSIRVRRAEPVWTARGKLMPLHISRYAPGPPSSS
jgi:hypothetical protein